MDKKDQDTILRSSPELKKFLDLNPRFLHLLQDGCRVFSQQMMTDILKDEDPPFRMCVMLLKRGPNAYNNFIKALSLTNQHRVLEILDATRSRLGYPAHEISLPTNGRSAKLPMRENEKEGAISFSYPQTPVSAEYKKKVLEPPNYLDAQAPSSPISRSHSVTDAIPPDYRSLDIKVVVGDEIKGLRPDAYHNRNIYPRGLAIIINYEKFDNEQKRNRRIGSEKDVIHLDQLLQQLGYEVTLKSDLTFEATIYELDHFAKRPEHQEADSTIVAIMSHGEGGTHEEGTRVCTRDMKFISSEEVLRRFNNVGCPLLKNKPKMFFFQFCRGENIDFGQRNWSLRQQSFEKMVMTDGNAVPQASSDFERSYDDMLIAYSTLPGYVSYREESEGTWFIKALCLNFMKYAHECHVERLLQYVDEQIKYWTANKNGKQTLEIVKRGFNKKFYFNPGLWKMP